MANKVYLWSQGQTPLFDPDVADQDIPSLLHIPAAVGKMHAACIVAPGGSYVYKEMEKEGVRIGEALSSMGVSAFVLDYRVKPYSIDCALLDAQRAFRFLRHNADAYRIDPGKIGIIGFSAGGHLAGMCSVHFDAGNAQSPDPIERQSCRPDYVIPCYAMLDPQTVGDTPESMLEFLGIDYLDAWRFSPTRILREDSPPAFLWQTREDGIVPVRQALDYADALAEKKIPFELHLYEKGPHGLGLAKDERGACAWPQALETWLRSRYIIG